jgi:hypothetical protein
LFSPPFHAASITPPIFAAFIISFDFRHVFIAMAISLLIFTLMPRFRYDAAIAAIFAAMPDCRLLIS